MNEHQPPIVPIESLKLTDEQRRDLATRAIIAAELLKEGAEHDAYQQLCSIIDEMHPEDRERTRRNESLNRSIQDIFKSEVRIRNALLRAGFANLRDILVAGSDRVYDVRSIGDAAIEDIRKVIAAMPDMPAWKEAPTPEDAATLADNLDQVTGLVFPYTEYVTRRNGVPIAAPSVHAILNASPNEREAMILYRFGSFMPKGRGDELLIPASEYASRFEAAKKAQTS